VPCSAGLRVEPAELARSLRRVPDASVARRSDVMRSASRWDGILADAEPGRRARPARRGTGDAGYDRDTDRGGPPPAHRSQYARASVSRWRYKRDVVGVGGTATKRTGRGPRTGVAVFREHERMGDGKGNGEHARGPASGALVASSGQHQTGEDAERPWRCVPAGSRASRPPSTTVRSSRGRAEGASASHARTR
jgi:hypothetical protein